ncbi:MAG: c-type cytochrome [Candidatus Kapabacteria bacterium]|nr:c-type cytochrome [Candidatus Kapabacteria bacterium]
MFALLGIATTIGCGDATGTIELPLLETPKDFPAIITPKDNPYSPEKAELGRYLFYDTRFSADYSVSCASCHQQQHAFSDGFNRVSKGFAGRTGTRNAMALTNIAYNTSFFWDGGVPTLEQQAIAPIIHPDEMNMNTDTLVARLQTEPRYRELFRNAWNNEEITLERITKSLATFQRTLISSNAPYDRWRRGQTSAMTASAVRGNNLFFGEEGDCFHCHVSFNFTDNTFHNNGIDSVSVDEGRARVTNLGRDNGSFRTPTLRNIAVTPPYMHDGRFQTLEEVVRHYNSGGKLHPNRDPLMRPLGLSDQDITDIVAFLNALTDSVFISNPAFRNPW